MNLERVLLLLACTATACSSSPTAPRAPQPIATSVASSAPGPTASASSQKPDEDSTPRTVRVAFEGNQEVSSADLRAVMFVDKPTTEETAGVSNQAILERDALYIQALYYDRGYLTSRIEEPKVTIAKDGPFIDVVLRIHEGPKFRIGKLTIAERDAKGKEIEPIGKKKLRERIRLRDGEVFSRKPLVEDLVAIRSLYADASYPWVDADPEVKLDEAKAVADIDIRVARNESVVVDRIVIDGNKKTSTEDIKKSLQFAEGKPFSEAKLVATREKLLAAGMKRVDLSLEAKPSKTHITVNIEVLEKP